MASPFVIADAAVAVAADLRQYDRDLGTAEKSGTASGSRLANALRADFGGATKVVAGSAAALFGIALKGGAELTEAMARYRSETGATAEETAEAQKATVELFKTNLEGFDVISGVMARVRTDLGLTGEAQKEATQLALDYARVTGTDAVEAVAKLDDVTDGWNLTAEEQRDLLDKLKYSQEQYGGSVDANLQSLIAMTPALKAANLTYDDGIGILNLFAQAGVDAADASAAMTKALAKVKSPDELRRLVADIQATEDPFERAQKASELFGSKAGPKLAQALSVGSDGLGEFAVEGDVAAGAINRASDAIENTPLNWFKLQLKQVLGPLAEVAAGIGPIATGLGGLASLGAATGLGGFAKTFALKMLEAGKQGGEALIDGMGTATGAAGTVIGNLVAQAIDPHNPFFGKPLARVAAAAGALWGAIFGAATKVASVLAAVFVRLPGIGLLRAAVLASAVTLGTLQGSTLGMAAGKALPIAFVLGLAAVAKEVAGPLQDFGKELGDNFRPDFLADIGKQWAQWRATTDWPFGQRNAPDWAGASEEVEAGTTEIVEGAHRGLSRLGVVVTEDLGRIPGAAGAALAEAAARATGDIPTGMQRSAGQIAAAAREFLSKPIGEQLVLIGVAGLRAGADAALGVAAGLRQNRGNVDAAIAQLKEDLENRLVPKKEVAHDIGLLFGKTLSRGLRSADPVVKAQAQGTRALIEAQLIETIKAGGKAGEKIQDELEKKLKSKDPAVRAQAKRTKSLIDAALKEKTGARTPGDKIAGDLARDIAGGSGPVGQAAYRLGRTIATNILRGVTGSGALSTSSSNGSTGYYSGKALPAFAEGTSYVPADMLAYIHKGEMVVPASDAERIRQGVAGAGGDTYNHTELHMPDARNRDPFAVLDRAARLARWGVLSPRPAGG